MTTRIELVRAVIRREVDPAVAWGDHCATVMEWQAAASDAPELRLPAWTTKEAVENVQAEPKRLGVEKKRGNVHAHER
jgi:hypothetical protein